INKENQARKGQKSQRNTNKDGQESMSCEKSDCNRGPAQEQSDTPAPRRFGPHRRFGGDRHSGLAHRLPCRFRISIVSRPHCCQLKPEARCFPSLASLRCSPWSSNTCCMVAAISSRE